MAQKGLARATVVEAALRLLDEVGLDGLSVRRLAAELGVQNPALYWHFRNKQELLDEMSRALLAPDMGVPLDGETWQEWLSRRAHRYRSTLLAHRDGARLVAVANPGMTVARRFDQELEVLLAEGFTASTALQGIATLSVYTAGFVEREQGASTRPPTDLDALAVETPHVFAAVREGGVPFGDAAFDRGVRMIVDGMAAALARER